MAGADAGSSGTVNGDTDVPIGFPRDADITVGDLNIPSDVQVSGSHSPTNPIPEGIRISEINQNVDAAQNAVLYGSRNITPRSKRLGASRQSC